MDDEQAVSWMAIGEDARVVDAAGEDIGRVDAVLGDDEEGIFHGVALDLKGWGGHVELPAQRVTRITRARVYTDLGPDEGKTLQELRVDQWFEFEGRSRFLRRVKWEKDD